MRDHENLQIKKWRYRQIPQQEKIFI
jgi:hypothetical protein